MECSSSQTEKEPAIWRDPSTPPANQFNSKMDMSEWRRWTRNRKRKEDLIRSSERWGSGWIPSKRSKFRSTQIRWRMRPNKAAKPAGMLWAGLWPNKTLAVLRQKPMVQFKDVLCMATGSQKMFQAFRLSTMTCRFDFHAESNKAITWEVSTFYI